MSRYICRINTIARIFPCSLYSIVKEPEDLLLPKRYYGEEIGEGLINSCGSVVLLMLHQVSFWPSVFTCSSCSSKKFSLHVSKAASQLLWYSAFFF